MGRGDSAGGPFVPNAFMKDSLIGGEDICWITVSFLLTPRQGSDIAHLEKGSCATANASPLGTPLCLLSSAGEAHSTFSPAGHLRDAASQLGSLALLSAITCTSCPPCIYYLHRCPTWIWNFVFLLIAVFEPSGLLFITYLSILVSSALPKEVKFLYSGVKPKTRQLLLSLMYILVEFVGFWPCHCFCCWGTLDFWWTIWRQTLINPTLSYWVLSSLENSGCPDMESRLVAGSRLDSAFTWPLKSSIEHKAFQQH